MSGSLTISMSGTPVRFRSTRLTGLRSSCISFPASSSMWIRVIPIRFFPPLISTSTQPCSAGGCGVLGDLVPLGKIGVEVVLPGEVALPVEPAVGREGHPDHELHDLPVEHRQHPGHPEADGAGVGVGRRPELRRAAAEDLRIREELGVDLQPDDRFKFHYSVGLLFSICACFS